MKKALLIVAMLLSVVPVMATTTITAVNEGAVFELDGVKQQTVRIDYSSTVDVRAFALDINIDAGPTFDSIRDYKTGESNVASPGYGIFPSRFRDFIVVTGPNWADTNYSPLTAWNEPGATNTGIGWPKMIVEMGTLYAGEPNKPALSGTLFRFDVNSENGTGLFHMTIAANALRGGVVGNDGSAIPDVCFVGTDINFEAPLCTVPNVVNLPEATATANIVTAGFILGNRTTACSDTIVAGNVISTNPAFGGTAPCGSAIDYVVSTGPCTCTVPNVVSEPEATATANIIAAGFVLGNRTENCSDVAGIIAGDIISTTPVGGSSAACGSAVDYVVSTGPCCATPLDRIGFAPATAVTDWQGQGFVNFNGTAVVDCNGNSGKVISYNPTTCVPLSTTINYTYGINPTVPSIVGLTKTAAEAAIIAAHLTVGTETGVFSDTIPINQVTVQGPAAGTSVACGSAVTLSYVCRTVKCLAPKCKGDLTGDNWVRTNDIAALAAIVSSYPAPTYRAQSTSCLYVPCGDINGDNWVRSTDIASLSAQISGYPAPTYRCSCGTANCPYTP